MAKVSVIIPTYNQEGYLGEAIQSVLDQTFSDLELIIVDDGSTDNTREVIEKFKDNRVRYIYKENGGVSSARNTGIKVSKGEYIAFLDSDDVYLPQNLEIKVKLLDSRQDVGMVWSDAYLFDNSTGATISRVWRDKKGPYPGLDPVKALQQPLKELLHWGCFIGPDSTMIRRQVFDTIGNFDESLPTHEDWDLSIRIVQRFPIEIIDMPLFKVRRHSTSLTRSQDKMYWGEVAVSNKLIRSGSLSREELKLLNKRMLHEHMWYGRLALLGGRKAAARKALISGIRLNPWNVKLYVYLGLSILGTSKVLALRSWKKDLRRRPVRRQPPGKTRPISS